MYPMEHGHQIDAREAGRLERHKKGKEEPNSEKRIHHREGKWMR
jgi:hypothetical protein